MNDYPMQSGLSINYTTNSQRRYPEKKITRTIATPIVVSREDLINSLTGVTEDYKRAMDYYNDWGTAIGKAVDQSMVEKMLSTPQNKGRLESELPIESALMGGLLKGFQAYDTVQSAKLANEKEAYLNYLKEIEMKDALKAREEAAAAKNAELNKKVIEETHYTDAIPNEGEARQKLDMYNAAASAIQDLHRLSKGGIGGWNNEADSRWNSETTAKLLGQREAALSALIPITNAVAKASGGSGINTLGEMMAYLGIPENATSAQIAGALPGIIKKMPIEVRNQLPFTAEELEKALNGGSAGGFTMDDMVMPVRSQIPQMGYGYGQPYPYSPIPNNFYNANPYYK